MGEHLVSILKNGRHVVNSPITIMVVQAEIGDASRVKAHGDGLVQGTTFNNTSFVVDTREAGQYIELQQPQLYLMKFYFDRITKIWEPITKKTYPAVITQTVSTHIAVLVYLSAGYGGLALSIEGPSKVDIQTEDLEDGTCGVTYCPTEPGNYIVSIRFNEEHVPGKANSFSQLTLTGEKIV